MHDSSVEKLIVEYLGNVDKTAKPTDMGFFEANLTPTEIYGIITLPYVSGIVDASTPMVLVR